MCHCNDASIDVARRLECSVMRNGKLTDVWCGRFGTVTVGRPVWRGRSVLCARSVIGINRSPNRNRIYSLISASGAPERGVRRGHGARLCRWQRAAVARRP